MTRHLPDEYGLRKGLWQSDAEGGGITMRQLNIPPTHSPSSEHSIRMTKGCTGRVQWVEAEHDWSLGRLVPPTNMQTCVPRLISPYQAWA